MTSSAETCAPTTERPCLGRAAFSRCGTYRYALWRTWDGLRPTVLFIGLNPSTADAERDDPTIRRCIAFARAWGYGGLAVANLFAFRSPDPRALRRAHDPIGPRTDRWLARLARESQLVIAAWGVHGAHLGRADAIRGRLGALHCIGLTKDGAPRHPLYVRRDARPMPFDIAPPSQ